MSVHEEKKENNKNIDNINTLNRQNDNDLLLKNDPIHEESKINQLKSNNDNIINIKSINNHCLENTWVLWYDNPKKKLPEESWEENLKSIYTFNTIEDFWCLYNNILTPSKLSIGSNYHLFKKGIRPMWEDPMNENGGKWVLTNGKNRRTKLDDYWLYIIMSMIGETLEDSNDICGAVVSVRKPSDRIALWTKSSQNELLQKKIGTNFRKVLQLAKSDILKYQSHADACASGSSFQNQVHYEA